MCVYLYADTHIRMRCRSRLLRYITLCVCRFLCVYMCMFTHTSEHDVDLFCCLAYLFFATLHIFGQVYICMFTHTSEYKVDLFSCLAYLLCCKSCSRCNTGLEYCWTYKKIKWDKRRFRLLLDAHLFCSLSERAKEPYKRVCLRGGFFCC